MTDVRVRFAPSPTGAPHIGNVRTALFNWLWARHMGGKFILRVEDTDQSREVDNGLELIVESLRFLGLDWDEGPDVGGAFGPYRQSERLAVYQRHAEELVSGGAAYYCYCTPEELADMRREQEARGEPTKYDRRCRWLLPTERAQQKAEGRPHVVRLAVPLEGSTTLHDLIHGDIIIPNESVDDQVLIKSDGFPTYHLAVVVDDHLMQITHVLRVDEWISSFPKHILLYQAFGWEPPLFGHVPIVLGPDRKKLSKRHGATSVDMFRNEGYLAEALINFLALLGWSWDDKAELFTREQLVELFTLDHLHHSPAIFDRTKLDWMNGYYIRTLAPDDLAARLLPFLTRAGLEADLKTVKMIAPLVQERLKRLDEIPPLVDFIFQSEIEYDPELLIPKNLTAANALAVLQSAKSVLDAPGALDDGEELEHALRAAGENLSLKPAQFFGILRVAVTGKTVTPPLVGTMRIMGRARTLERISAAIDKLQAMVVKA